MASQQLTNWGEKEALAGPFYTASFKSKEESKNSCQEHHTSGNKLHLRKQETQKVKSKPSLSDESTRHLRESSFSVFSSDREFEHSNRETNSNHRMTNMG